MSDLHWLTATEIQQQYAQKTLSPVELVGSLLGRIRAHDPVINSFITLDEDSVFAQARQAETELAAEAKGRTLLGIPVAIKDNIDAEGLRTTCHSRVGIDNVAVEDAVVVRKLREAGAIILGKVATWEFAIGGPSEDLPFPPARNPWNPDFQPGGSSTGSAAGLAAGFFPLSIGTDTGGSVRHPAAACGVIGLKPTYDLVSRHGVFPLSYTLDHVGPLARSVDDIALMLNIMASSSSPGSNGNVVNNLYTPSASGVRGIRVGFVRSFHTKDFVADPEVSAALENAAAVLARIGANVVDVTLPSVHEFGAVNRVIMHSEAWSVHKEQLQATPDKYGQTSRQRLMCGAFISSGDYVVAQRVRRRLMSAVNDAFAHVDVLLTANAMDTALPVKAADTGSPVNVRQARTPFNVTGHPALSMMTGLSSAGLPMSMQLVARHYDEKLLLKVASAFERETHFSDLRPELPDA